MTREQERDELHKTIWRIANDLRGNVDGWDFKAYVLGILFYRFISENLTNYINEEEHINGQMNFNYADIDDNEAEIGREDTITEKGFFILPSELFENIKNKAQSDKNLNETIAKVFKNIEHSATGYDSEDDIKGLFDDIDVNSNKLGGTIKERNERLVKIINAVGDLSLGNYKNNKNDLFGDAYEYLMTMYASNAGKSGGEFFTPQEVSELLAEIAINNRTSIGKVYDPCCGSGSLLLKFAKVLGKENVKHGFYGQEVNITTYNLCRINMFLHDINYEKFDIRHGDTLKEYKHLEHTEFDCIVSNPPYSVKWEGDENPLYINDPRFSPAGVLAPKSKADLAFTLHMLHKLSSSGTAAIVEFPGVLYRGGAEQKIRKYLIENNFIDTVIQLPPDLFFGTSIATCIIVLKKNKKTNDILFIDASNEFVRGGSKNKLSKTNQAKILETYKERKNIDHFSSVISNIKIAENDYGISVGSYVEQKNTKKEIDIDSLNLEIEDIIKKQEKLRISINEIISNLKGI